jgi:hypothetical protein
VNPFFHRLAEPIHDATLKQRWNSLTIYSGVAYFLTKIRGKPTTQFMGNKTPQSAADANATNKRINGNVNEVLNQRKAMAWLFFRPSPEFKISVFPLLLNHFRAFLFPVLVCDIKCLWLALKDSRNYPLLQDGLMEHEDIPDRYKKLEKSKRRKNLVSIGLAVLCLILVLAWLGPILLRR